MDLIGTNKRATGGKGGGGGDMIPLKASDASVIKDSKDDQNRTSTRSCRSNPDQ